MKFNYKASNKDSLSSIQEKHNKKKLDSIARILEMKKNSKAKDLGLEGKNNDNSVSTGENSNQFYNPYEESAQTLSVLKKEDSSDLDRTRKILFELSDLMTNFSFKVQQHHEMTQQSKL